MNAFVVNRPGLVEATLNKLLTAEHEVTSVVDLAPGFRLLTFSAPALRNRRWTPGHMVQLTFGGWEHRAYTPLSFDALRGEFTFLARLHGQGIASQWFATLKGGERISIGPTRAGLNLTAMQRPLVFFGDETSVSTAAAFRFTDGGFDGVTCVFEADDVEAMKQVLAALNLEALVVERGAAEVVQACRGARDLVLTGRSQSIQRLYKEVKAAHLGLRKITTIAYWSPGKKGMSGVHK